MVLHVIPFYKLIGPPASAIQSTATTTSRNKSSPLPTEPPENPVIEPPEPVKLPDDIVMKLNPMTLEYWRRSKDVRKRVDEDLKSLHCQVQWPEASDSLEVVLHCTLDASNSEDVELVDKWASTCRDHFTTHHLNSLSSGSVSVNADVWDGFHSEFLQYETGDDELLVKVDGHTVQYIGTEKKAERFRKLANNNIHRLTNIRPQTTEETVHLESHEPKLLRLMEFEESCGPRYGSSKAAFMMEMSENGVTFVGSVSDVDDAKVHDMISGILFLLYCSLAVRLL